MKQNKGENPQEKIHRPASGQKATAKPGASGVPSRGGSRQGNIGHQSGDRGDNPHR